MVVHFNAWKHIISTGFHDSVIQWQSNQDWMCLFPSKSVKDLDDEQLLSFSEGSGTTTTGLANTELSRDQPVKLVHKNQWTLAKSFWQDKNLGVVVTDETKQIRCVIAGMLRLEE